MTRIRFYHGASDRLQAAVEWLAQAYAARQRVVVYAPDPVIADRIDQMLWTRGSLSFVPHCRAESPLARETPVLIASRLQSPTKDEHLLNLDHAIPVEFARYEEVIEIVSTDDGDRQPARARYRFYRERGYELIDRKAAEGYGFERA